MCLDKINYLKLLFKVKVRAGTLVELIVASILLLIVFGVSLNILINTESVSNAALKVKAYALVTSVIESIKRNDELNEESNKFGNIIIHTESMVDSLCPSLIFVVVTAQLENTKIELYQESIIVDE